MKRGLISAVVALCMCGIVSAYAVCYSLRSLYCKEPGSYVGSHTLTDGEPCYPGMVPVYVETTPGWVEIIDSCHLQWQGAPEIKYNRQVTFCWAYVYWYDCYDQKHVEFWGDHWAYYRCIDPGQCQ